MVESMNNQRVWPPKNVPWWFAAIIIAPFLLYLPLLCLVAYLGGWPARWGFSGVPTLMRKCEVTGWTTWPVYYSLTALMYVTFAAGLVAIVVCISYRMQLDR